MHSPLPLRSIEAEGERSKNGEGTERERSKSRTYHSSQSKKCTLGSAVHLYVPITTRHSSMNVTLGQVPSTMTDKEGEKDTLQLSQDGQYLSGKMDKDTPFKLKRKK